MCWHVWVQFKQIWHGFLSPRLHFFSRFVGVNIAGGRGGKRSSVWIRSSNWEREESKPCGSFLGCSPLTDGLAGLREATAYVRNGSPPSIKGRVRIRAIPQQMNTYTHKHCHREREDSHMEIQRHLFYFKIILFFFSHWLLLSVILLPCLLKVRYYPLLLNISGPHSRSPPLRPTSSTLNKTL